MRLDTASKRVLIFGIDGFTGNHLSAYLQNAGYDVYGTSYSGTSGKTFKVDITYKADIDTVLKEVVPDFIIVLSGISFPAHGHNEDFYAINTIGAINILDVLIHLNQNPKKIIMASSATVYGNQGVEVLDETLCPKPTNHYGASKYAMESLSRNYFEKLNIIIARPFNYTGINQEDNFLIPKIIKHFKEMKQTIELGNIDVSREFNDVGYVCEIYKKLLESSVSSEVVNLSANRGIKLLDVIDMMNEMAGYKIKVKINPDFVREGEIKTLTGSCEKLFGLIGEVEQKEFKETLRDMLEA
ncbi:GDP-mannose 4,6-dehydratase [Sulfurimonas sp. RIFOXYB12_FULL_35_9]|uniref:GDP-mannose 4,6-dehydratase n=1 Tax=Sulfurimonas sp. RIFOXYB12_FULL_35_9 TaxID=1802256 RepID=UPI0008C7B436|nr:GDP-mannose 4,6-dehydratase [Sulfurimonas sp. RIFOXYB12_FULL_35_9]OHE05490.1 MAG: epimerase [Sulfurimonas sp. RIFOXYB12_FULL_35_9]